MYEFMNACNKGDLDMVHELLPLVSTSTALTIASPHPRIFNSLLEKTKPTDKHLRLACQYGNVDAVKFLLSKVDPSFGDNIAMKEAIASKNSKVVELLLSDPRVDPSAGDNFAIKSACKNGSTEIVEMLIKDGRVDPTVDNNYAIRVACWDNHPEIVKILLAAGADANGDLVINGIENQEIKDLLLRDKYRVDGKIYQEMRQLINV
jgi:ankyrin repeat protein